MNGKNMKLVAATAGTAGLLAMGAIAASFSAAAEEPTPGPVTTPEATTGETTTEEAPPATPTTTIAVPEIEGPAPLPTEQEDAK